MIMAEELPPILRAMYMSHERHLVDWTETRALEERASFMSSTTPLVQSSGRSSWAHLLMKGLMESPPTPQETSMLQDTLRVNRKRTRTQETKTS